MKRFLVSAFLFVTACSTPANTPVGTNGLAGAQGPTGPQGPAGPQGSPGLPGVAAAKVLVWADADNRPVNGGSTPSYVDSTGIVWPLDTESGQLLQPPSLSVVWTDPGCSVAQYAAPISIGSTIPLPRVPYSAGGKIYVRGDMTKSLSMLAGQVFSGGPGSCSPVESAVKIIPIEGSPVTMPSSPFTGPLHQEID